MANNSAEDYGVDLKALIDIDDFGTEVSGLALVVQDAIHTITCDTFLGPGGEGRGYDVRKLLGATTEELQRAQLVVPDVLGQDDRIGLVEVYFDQTKDLVSGMIDVRMRLKMETAFGPFELTRNLSDMTAGDLEELEI